MKTLITTIAILMFLSGCNKNDSQEKISIATSDCNGEVCVGQVWYYKSPNPFSKFPEVTRKVIELNGDYVKYIDIEYIDNQEKYFGSDLVEYFKYNSECVSGPCK